MILADESGAYNVSYMMGRVVGFIILAILVLLVVKFIRGKMSSK